MPNFALTAEGHDLCFDYKKIGNSWPRTIATDPFDGPIKHHAEGG